MDSFCAGVIGMAVLVGVVLVLWVIVRLLRNSSRTRRTEKYQQIMQERERKEADRQRQTQQVLPGLIQQATSGDLSALQDLVTFAGSKDFQPDQRIAQALADIFFSEHVTKDQKTLIWSLRDRVVFKEKHEKTFWHRDDEGEHESTHYFYQDYTFREYLVHFCDEQIQRL